MSYEKSAFFEYWRQTPVPARKVVSLNGSGQLRLGQSAYSEQNAPTALGTSDRVHVFRGAAGKSAAAQYKELVMTIFYVEPRDHVSRVDDQW